MKEDGKKTDINLNGQSESSAPKTHKQAIEKIKSEKKMSSFAKTIMAIAFCFVAATVFIIALNHVRPKPEPEPNIIDVYVVEEALNDIQELATEKYTYTNIEVFKNSREFPLVGLSVPFTEKSFKIKYNGEIKAFFDMSDCEVKVTESKVSVALPGIKLSHSLDNDIVEEHSNIFNPISLKDQKDVKDDLKTLMENRAINKGILDEARDSAESAIAGLLTPLLSEDQTIEIKQTLAGRSADEELVKTTSSKAANVKSRLQTIDQPE